MKTYSVTHSCGKAHIGKLKTAHGIIETPFFMPVATKSVVKTLSPWELQDAGTRAIISNSLLMSLKPGLPMFRRYGGIHEFMKFKGVIATDSGGFQIVREGFKPKITEKGFTYTNPYNHKRALLSPEQAIKNQETIGSDIMMCLDDVPEVMLPRQMIARKVRRTHDWALRCLDAHKKKKQLLFGITQGGLHADLRKKSFDFMHSQNFDGISLGGFCFGEEKKDMFRTVKSSLEGYDHTRPVYLMGVGSPQDLLTSIGLGCDMFDSVYPTRTARRGSLMTRKGPLRIERGVFRIDQKPIEKGCTCFTCKNFSRAYLHHLFKIKEMFGYRLASIHNIHFIHQLIEDAKSHIKKGTFAAFRTRFMKNYKINDVVFGKLQAR